MGFFTSNKNNKNYGEIIFFGSQNDVKGQIKRVSTTNFGSDEKFDLDLSSAIIVKNNESIIFDFDGYSLTRDKDYILEENPENILLLEDGSEFLMEYNEDPYLKGIIKISIDFGDGTNIIQFKPIKSSSSSWNKIEHRFAFKNESDFSTSEEKSIKISVYSIDGKSNSFTIKYTVDKVSAAQYGLDLNLVNANITNDKNISYIFNDNNNKQIIIAENIKS